TQPPATAAPGTPTQPGAPAPTIVNLGCGSTQVTAGERVTCAPVIEGTADSYAWTVNGTAAGSGALLSNQYTTPGPRFITLRACNSGGCDEAATTISVVAAPAPQLSLSTFALDFGSGG